MKTSITKMTVDEIRQRYDGEVDRFSDLSVGQATTVDAKEKGSGLLLTILASFLQTFITHISYKKSCTNGKSLFCHTYLYVQLM